MLHQQQQSILSGLDQARQSGFVVGEDWSATDAIYPPGSMGWYARLSAAQAITAELRAQAGAFATQEYQTATDMVSAGGDLGGDGAIHRHIQAVDNHFKTDGPTPQPSPPPNPPQTGEPIKRQPAHIPPSVINMHAGEQPDPGKHQCSAWEIAKDTTIGVGGAAGIASGIAGEVPTAGGTTAVILAGIGGLWDSIDRLSECE